MQYQYYLCIFSPKKVPPLLVIIFVLGPDCDPKMGSNKRDMKIELETRHLSNFDFPHVQSQYQLRFFLCFSTVVHITTVHSYIIICSIYQNIVLLESAQKKKSYNSWIINVKVLHYYSSLKLQCFDLHCNKLIKIAFVIEFTFFSTPDSSNNLTMQETTKRVSLNSGGHFFCTNISKSFLFHFTEISWKFLLEKQSFN